MFLFYSLLGSVVIVIASAADRTRNRYNDLCNAAFLPVVSLVVAPLVSLIGILRPRTLDAYLYAADSFLGLSSFGFAQAAHRTPWLGSCLGLVYGALPVAVATALISNPLPARRAFLTASLGALVCFCLVPATGPLYAFPGFPYAHPHNVGLMSVPTDVPRNAFPSLHFGWALLALWNARGRRFRALLLVFAFLTGLATIGTGQHYFVDLIAAVPFCLAAQWIAERIPQWFPEWYNVAMPQHAIASPDSRVSKVSAGRSVDVG
jgi:hypothetical protein